MGIAGPPGSVERERGGGNCSDSRSVQKRRRPTKIFRKNRELKELLKEKEALKELLKEKEALKEENRRLKEERDQRQ